MVEILTKERVQELKDQFEKFKKENPDISDFETFFDRIDANVVSLDIACRGEAEDVSKLILEVKKLTDMPEMHGEAWATDPWKECYESYKTANEKMLKGIAFRNWMIKFQRLAAMKLLTLLDYQKNKNVKLESLKIQKNIFDKYIGDMGVQMKTERDRYINFVVKDIEELQKTVNRHSGILSVLSKEDIDNINIELADKLKKKDEENEMRLKEERERLKEENERILEEKKERVKEKTKEWG